MVNSFPCQILGTWEIQPLTVTVETHPRPHRSLAAFFLTFSCPACVVFSAGKCGQIWTQWNHASFSPTSTFANTATSRTSPRARAVQMCYERLTLSACHFRTLSHRGEWEGTFHASSSYYEPDIIHIASFIYSSKR